MNLSILFYLIGLGIGTSFGQNGPCPCPKPDVIIDKLSNDPFPLDRLENLLNTEIPDDVRTCCITIHSNLTQITKWNWQELRDAIRTCDEYSIYKWFIDILSAICAVVNGICHIINYIISPNSNGNISNESICEVLNTLLEIISNVIVYLICLPFSVIFECYNTNIPASSIIIDILVEFAYLLSSLVKCVCKLASFLANFPCLQEQYKTASTLLCCLINELSLKFGAILELSCIIRQIKLNANGCQCQFAVK